MIGGVTDALKRGVAVNINDAPHVVRGEGRLVESDQSAGGGGGGVLTDGLMGSEIEASGRVDELISSTTEPCRRRRRRRGVGDGREGSEVKGQSGTNHQPSSAVNVPQLPPAGVSHHLCPTTTTTSILNSI